MLFGSAYSMQFRPIRYDGWDRRVRRATAAGMTRYVYDGSHVALELDGSGPSLPG